MNNVLKSNKGQSLVLFIVFLPMILMLGTFVVDLSFAKYNENKIENISKTVIKYGLEHINEDPKDDMIKLIYQNDSEIDTYNIDIDKDINEVNVEIIKSSKGLFGSIVGRDIYTEKCKYKGHIEDGKVIIERNDDNEN